MGSKVSSKMAAPTARIIQAVRPHAPMIKFPNRLGAPKPNAQEALKSIAVNFQQQSSPGSLSAAAPPPLSRPSGPVTRLPGTPDTLASIQTLPQRYRRRPLAVEEIDYIQRGGPEWHTATQWTQPKSLSVEISMCLCLILSLRTRGPTATPHLTVPRIKNYMIHVENVHMRFIFKHCLDVMFDCNVSWYWGTSWLHSVFY